MESPPNSPRINTVVQKPTMAEYLCVSNSTGFSTFMHMISALIIFKLQAHAPYIETIIQQVRVQKLTKENGFGHICNKCGHIVTQ